MDTEGNKSDVQVHHCYRRGGNIHKTCLVITEAKSKNGVGWWDLLTQSTKYSDFEHNTEGSFVIGIKGTYIAFFLYQPDVIYNLHMGLKAPGLEGLVGLFYNHKESRIEILPLINHVLPQMAVYDCNKKGGGGHRIAITAILRWISLFKSPPEIDIDNVNHLNHKIIMGEIEGDSNKKYDVIKENYIREPIPLKIEGSINSKIHSSLGVNGNVENRSGTHFIGIGLHKNSFITPMGVLKSLANKN